MKAFIHIQIPIVRFHLDHNVWLLLEEHVKMAYKAVILKSVIWLKHPVTYVCMECKLVMDYIYVKEQIWLFAYSKIL